MANAWAQAGLFTLGSSIGSVAWGVNGDGTVVVGAASDGGVRSIRAFRRTQATGITNRYAWWRQLRSASRQPRRSGSRRPLQWHRIPLECSDRNGESRNAEQWQHLERERGSAGIGVDGKLGPGTATVMLNATTKGGGSIVLDRCILPDRDVTQGRVVARRIPSDQGDTSCRAGAEPVL